MSDERALDGKVVIISGAGGGIGTAAVENFLEHGAQVVALDLAGGGLDSLAAIRNDDLATLDVDVRSEDDWGRARDVAVERFGRIDGLVNNAGIEGSVVPLTEYSSEMFELVMDVNIKGVWLGMKVMAPVMADNGGGSIVNVSSVAGLGGASNLSAYSASKHAVIGLSKTAALELAADEIRCNAVCPSPIRTRMMESLEDAQKSDDASREDIAALIALSIPRGRYGQPSEVADLMTFLLSDASAFLSGAAIPIDGAMKAR